MTFTLEVSAIISILSLFEICPGMTLCGQQDVKVKSLTNLLRDARCFAAVTNSHVSCSPRIRDPQSPPSPCFRFYYLCSVSVFSHNVPNVIRAFSSVKEKKSPSPPLPITTTTTHSCFRYYKCSRFSQNPQCLSPSCSRCYYYPLFSQNWQCTPHTHIHPRSHSVRY